VEPTSSAVTVPEGSFRCPECDFSTDVESSSLRAGDFCPECHRGSLEHHADRE
jgi:Zn finger protein HypA/HybF involved in hydrogenase expression